MIPTLLRIGLLAILFTISACDSSQTPPHSDKASESQLADKKVLNAASLKMFEQGAAALNENLVQAKQLQQAINEFLAQPNEQTLAAAQAQWLTTQFSLRKFYFYRQLCINVPQLFTNFGTLSYRISTYPIQPGFMDTYGSWLYSGIVHDIGFPLTAESLGKQHGLTDPAEAVLGLHAIEFMLYNSGAPRLASDFVAASELSAADKERGFEKVEELPINRRRALLALQAEILVADLNALLSAWQAQTAESFYFRWMEADTKLLNPVIKTSLANALSTIILELSAIKQANTESAIVSPAIALASQELQKQFLQHAVASIHDNVDLYAQDNTEALRAHLRAANNLLAATVAEVSEENTQQEKPREENIWSAVYAEIKQANDGVLKGF